MVLTNVVSVARSASVITAGEAFVYLAGAREFTEKKGK